jgi:hypothetical protein
LRCNLRVPDPVTLAISAGGKGMSTFCLVSILEDASFGRQHKGWTPNWSRSFSAGSGCLSLRPIAVRLIAVHGRYAGATRKGLSEGRCRRLTSCHKPARDTANPELHTCASVRFHVALETRGFTRLEFKL